jgi:hypothetical protein
MMSSNRSGVLLLFSAALLSVVLAGCTASGTAVVNSPAPGEVSGVIVRVGGPISQVSSQPKSVPMTAIAVVYSAKSGRTAISGTPVVKARTSGSAGGRFTLHLAPGGYVLVAETTSGAMISPPTRITISAGAVSRVTLTVPVP